MSRVMSNRWMRGAALALLPLCLVVGAAWLGGATDARAEGAESKHDEAKGNYVLGGEGAFLGVSLTEETEYDEGGARVTNVVDDSPADEAGIQDGDIIVAFDGKTIRGPVGLTKEIHAAKPGQHVEIVVVRDGGRRSLGVDLGDRADRMRFSFVAPRIELRDGNLYVPGSDIDAEELQRRIEEGMEQFGECEGDDCGSRLFWRLAGRPVLGVQLVDITPELREHLGADRDSGVLVSKVLGGMPAERAGIHVGDLIISVEGDKVSDAGDLQAALVDKVGETFDIRVIRDGTPMRISVTIPEPETEEPTGPRAGLILPAPAAPRAPRATPSPHVRRVPGVAPPAPVAAPEPPAPPAAVEAPAAPSDVRDVVAREFALQRAALERARVQHEAARLDLEAERAGAAVDRALARREAGRVALEDLRTERERVHERIERMRASELQHRIERIRARQGKLTLI